MYVDKQALPWTAKWGLLLGIWIRSTAGITYPKVMIWGASCSAGHTKKTTVITLYHVGFGLGNILSPQLFQPQYKLRYVLTWSVILAVASVFPMLLMLYLRWYLVKENVRRDRLKEHGGTEVGVVQQTQDSSASEEVVDALMLDLTNRENLAFRYML